MGGDGDELEAVESHQNSFMDGDGLDLSQNLFLDHAGEVLLTLNTDGLSWRSVETKDNELDGSCCFGLKICSGTEGEIKFSDVYAVEFINWGSINYSILPKTGISLLGHDSKMYRFTVHGFQRSKTRRSLWVLAMYTFGHQDLQTCQMWVNRINGSINMDVRRPKSLLVFVHPSSGERHGLRTWESVAPIFSRAKVKTKVTVTERAGHAFDVMASITDRELSSYDGVVAVGGDGFFNEIMNGLLSSRHKAPYPPAPMDVVHSAVNNGSALICDPNPNEINSKTSNQDEDQDPLLPPSQPNVSGFSKFRTEGGSCSKGKDPPFFFPNEWFRLGIIPAGSTDAIVICTTGTRDPITSALHIVLGKRVCLDIAQVVRWKTTVFSNDVAPFVRYAASFAGYGFYGDVIKESEKYRWMGPKRYDFVGTKVFMKHRSYEAEISYLEVKTEKVNSIPLKGHLGSEKGSRWGASNKPERRICRANCTVCNDYTNPNSMPKGVPITTTNAYPEESRWLRSKGRFLSVGAAVISCRNERAPDGLVADAHLADGFLHLILIKECPHAFYLWHLTQLARKGGDPLKFEFVEHHKTPAFTFTSSGKESIWNLDGELFQAHQLSAQVFRGLVSIFASGPEV